MLPNMLKQYPVIRKTFFTLLLVSTSLITGVSLAAGLSSDYDALPPTILSASSNTDPLVMLAMSSDHQLFVKAYTDYSDLDGDGTLDTTYTDTFSYYGYFDPNKCYTYGGNKFTPAATATGTNSHHCAGAQWSGNFLNWATMTRMDVLRKVLFGGKRSTDTNPNTILERALIPTDVHSFVKVFSTATAAEMQLYTPYAQTQLSMCNTTYQTSGSSESLNTTSAPPLLRVANNLWPGWATNEVKQCAFRNERNGGLGIEPDAADKVADLTVRVDVCVSGLEETNCKTYTNGNKKPTGLLQKFGERDNTPIRFGLMTGSYNRNLSGGVLRKDIKKIAGNTGADAGYNEIDTNTGQFINQGTTDNGVINTLSRMRISKYNFGTNKYSDCSSPGIASITEGNASTGCSNWGNPISEIYLEALRYFSGQTTPSAAFGTNDSTYIPSIPQISTWTDPMDATNYCASCNVVVISTGLNSFDTNQHASASDIQGLTGAADAATKTNTVGSAANENINGNTYIIGKGTGVSATDKQCTGKTVSNFSDAQGICPEVPTIEGGFYIAGLAHHAHITDLRTGVSFPGTQKVDTYSISLAEALPSFSIPVGGNTVTFQPHCEANSSGTAAPSASGWRACSLANVTIESLPAGAQTGSALFHWEDSTWGNDYDMDGVERIEWCVGAACAPGIAANQIKITASTPLANAGHKLLFGYTISGTGVITDGVKRVVERNGGVNFNLLYPPTGTNFPNAATYTASGSAAAKLNNPLWYAAKYGSFIDQNANDRPDQTVEWDNKNNASGAFIPDGVPDNFFQVTNPALLEAQLEKVFSEILGRTSSSTALAVLSTTSTGIGALYQALYDPVSQSGTNTITWGGRIHGLFIDGKGHIREDTNLNAQLDNYATDLVVSLYYSAPDERTLVQRYTSPDDGVTLVASGLPGELSSLKTIWNARDELSKLDAATIINQRTYTTQIANAANQGRYIFTWVDADLDGVIDPATEVLDFTAANFDVTNFGFLNVATETEADNIVDFIRGKEGISGFRSRTIDFITGNGVDEVWRLGDIINSTPVVVGPPSSRFDLIYGDTTYANFSSAYINRRQVLYAGANDGMLHAFNSGFYDEPNKEFDLTDPSATAVAHPLGSELWAYVPYNLLPHLKWLTETAYPHVYYVDGEPRAFDVNIFTAGVDANGINHPNGWGTILVVGMRLGGGSLTYDHDNDSGATTPDITTRSAYVILDITDPELPPVLLAELTHPNLGFTTSVPSLTVDRTPGPGNDWGNPTTNTWRLVFGSGPTDLDTVTSTQDARLFVYNLNTNTYETGGPIALAGNTNSFVGDPKSTDWNPNYVDDIVYFGTVGGTSAAPTGRLMRLLLDGTWTANTLLNPGQPFVSAPTTQADNDGRRWIFAGTGRLYTGSDNGSLTQQSYYGLKEPLTGGIPTYTSTLSAGTDLQNVTNVEIFADYSVNDPDTVLPAGTDTFAKLTDVVKGKEGWYRNFTADATNPSTRNLSSAAYFRELLLFTTYTPPVESSCLAEGTSNLYALYFRTGTAYPGIGLGNDPDPLTQNGDGSPLTLDNIDLGQGVASRVTVVPNSSGGSGSGTAMTQMGTGAIGGGGVTGVGVAAGRQSWREIFPD